MYLKKLKEHFIKKKFLKLIDEVNTQRKVSNKVIHSVAILTSEKFTINLDLQKKVEEILNVRNCDIFKFRHFNKLNKTSNTHFSDKEINWQGKIDNIILQSFLDQPFDLLISFFDKKNLYLEYATLQSKASFKVGFAKVNPSLYDIEIAGKMEEPTVFLNELNTYLKILKKLEN